MEFMNEHARDRDLGDSSDWRSDDRVLGPGVILQTISYRHVSHTAWERPFEIAPGDSGYFYPFSIFHTERVFLDGRIFHSIWFVGESRN